MHRLNLLSVMAHCHHRPPWACTILKWHVSVLAYLSSVRLTVLLRRLLTLHHSIKGVLRFFSKSMLQAPCSMLYAKEPRLAGLAWQNADGMPCQHFCQTFVFAVVWLNYTRALMSD